MENNWYGDQKQHFGNTDKERRQKKSVSFSTLIVCMLITAMLGGGLGSIIAMGGQSDASRNAVIESTVVASDYQAPAAVNEPVITTPAIATTGTAQTYTKVQIVEKTAPSIVGIDIQASNGYASLVGEGVASSSGSGIIVSQDGYIITNNHVIENAVKIMVYLNDDTEYEAKLIATDKRTDLAVIKIEAAGLTAVTMGDSDMLQVGEDVIAIGNPLGEFRGSATSGMVSAVSRTVEIDGTSMTLLQTDAAVNPGNSGGGLFNMKGELVGIINAKIASSSTEGLGFAIPVNSAKEVVSDLMDLGYVSGRAYLGVYMENVAVQSSTGNGYNLEDFFGYFGEGRRNSNYETRVRITQVVLGSAADVAGMHSGDIILKVGDTEVTNTAELSNAIGEYNAGDVANIVIQRDGEEISLSVTFGEYIPD